ncbi:zinc metalloprotease [Tritrichomonas musculus]|uniref:Zinc metalloprotease n=1 Tax=Tritrichomonas musculus TaxID=1915356 RepID=A0ABR2KAR9_9EUKA
MFNFEIPLSLLPRLLIISPLVAFIIESIVLLVQYSHLSSSPDSNYHSITDYLVHVSEVNNLRFQILSNLLTLFTTLLTCVLFSKLWELSNNSIWIFIIIYDVFVLVIDQIPKVLLQEYFVNNSNISFYQIILNLLFSLINSVIGEIIVIGILNIIAKYSKLQPTEEDQAQQAQINQNQTINDNNENANAVNNHTRCSCCIGHFWLILMITFLVAVFLFNFFAVDIIMMDENNFTQIDNVTIAKSINALTDTIGFPYENVYMQIEASPNAFYTGIFDKKVIIIAQSLISLMDSVDQLCAVVAHELGHWSHKDMVKSFLFSLFLVVLVSLFFLFIQKIGLSGIGLGNQMPVVIVLICVTTLFMLPQLLLLYTSNIMARSFENNADCFAASLGLPIGEALTKLTESVYSEIESAEIYSILYENHPSLTKRLAHIQKCIAK